MGPGFSFQRVLIVAEIYGGAMASTSDMEDACSGSGPVCLTSWTEEIQNRTRCGNVIDCAPSIELYRLIVACCVVCFS